MHGKPFGALLAHFLSVTSTRNCALVGCFEMSRLFSHSLNLLSVSGILMVSSVAAQDFCYPQAYRLEPTTCYEQQTVQRMRPVYRTEMVEEQVKSFRPVVRTRTEMRDVTVPVNTVETAYKEERYTVWKPVTDYRDETYTETEYVTETSEREEQYTTYRPVTETKFYQQQYAVQRPVTETRYYQQQYTVQRPVVETQMQTQQYTTLRPQTTMVNQTVDAGGYVPQTTVTPGSMGYALQYKRDLYATPGPLGIFARVRGGNVVAPYYTPPTAQTQYVYRPNYIEQQVAQTSYMPVTEQVQVPVQVQRMQTEVVTQNVPVQTTSMQTEMVTQNVPVQSTRMVPTTMVRKVPYVVQRPVTTTKTRKVPVTQWVTEEQVRKVPVQTSKIRYETRKVPQTVQYTEYEEVTQTVRRPVTRQVYEPYTETIVVPRQTVMRVPMSYYDPFGSAITHGFSSFSQPSGSSSVIAQPASDTQLSLKPAESFDDAPRTGLKSVETTASEPESEEESGSIQLNGPDAGTENDLPAPSDGGASMIDAGFKIYWNPSLSRSI